MRQVEDSIFPMEDALEMVIMFERSGNISYANAMAKQKPEYDDALCGKHISEVFPNTFPVGKDADEAEGLLESERCSLVAYRQNHTCFPVEARILKRHPIRKVISVWPMIFWKKNFLAERLNGSGRRRIRQQR